MFECIFEINLLKVYSLSRNSYYNTIGQSSLISFATRMARPLLKLKCSVLLVMYNWLNGFYCEINGKYNVTLLFYGSNLRRASLLRPAHQ